MPKQACTYVQSQLAYTKKVRRHKSHWITKARAKAHPRTQSLLLYPLGGSWVSSELQNVSPRTNDVIMDISSAVGQFVERKGC